MRRLAGCIDRGLAAVSESQSQTRLQVEQVRAIAETLDPCQGPKADRQPRFVTLREDLASQPEAIPQHLAKVMSSFEPGLFAGDDESLPRDNLELERWFRNPKGHARRIHGRRHAGASLVREGPSLALALDAHLRHPEPFAVSELLPYRNATTPFSEQASQARHQTMRKARSKHQRPALLAHLEVRYLNSA